MQIIQSNSEAKRIAERANSGARGERPAARRREIENLLPPQKRWVAHRKAEIVTTVRSGLPSLEETRGRHALEEVGLRAAWVQRRRPTPSRRIQEKRARVGARYVAMKCDGGTCG